MDYDPDGNGNASDAAIAGWVILAKNDVLLKDDTIVGNSGQGGQGVMPIPNVYNGWVQKLPAAFCSPALTAVQLNPLGNLPPENCN